MNSLCSQESSQYSCIHLPPICHCYSHYPKVINAVPQCFEPKKSSIQFNDTPNEFKYNEISQKDKPNFIAQNHVSIAKSDVQKDDECKLEILDEKDKHKSNDIEMKVFKVIKKGRVPQIYIVQYFYNLFLAKSYDGINLEMEQRKPLLSDLSKVLNTTG
jgi:hypothetical protein